MAMASVAARTTVIGSAAAMIELRAAATNKPKVMELGVSCNTGATITWGWGRPQAIGLTPTTTAFQDEDLADPAPLTTLATAWGTGPTVPLIFHRRIALTNLTGTGFIWIWPRGFPIAASSSVVLWNITSAVATDTWAVVDE